MSAITQSTNDDELRTRATELTHALAGGDVDAVDVSYEPTGAGWMVHAWLHESSVDAAEALAEEYGFELYGETLTDLKAKYHQGAAAAGRNRYRFEIGGGR